MSVIQMILFSVVIFLIPAVAGMIFTGESRDSVRLPFVWVSGQILLWAGFQVISIPLILMEKSFSLVVFFFGIYTGIFFLLGLFVSAKRYPFEKKEKKADSGSIFLWTVFGALLILQLVLTVCMAYEEGDDAFYVAISSITESSDTMYCMLPYTGMTTGLDARHGLAPFPIWVAYLARLSGIPAVTVAQVALPVALILMAYAIYYLMAEQLFGEKKKNICLFMILTELLVLFGGYSVYSAENFLLVRASQGKAVIANIILPFLLYLMMVLLKKVQKHAQVKMRFWMLFAGTMISGCLCSTLATILTCMFVGIAGLCTAVSYRSWKVLFPMAACCVFPVAMALLYFVLG